MPSPLDPCANAATTIGQLGQMLCYLSGQISDLHTDLDNFITTSNSSFGALETNTDDAISKLDAIRDWLGYVGEPDTVRENLVNIIGTQGDQDAALASLQDTIGTKDPTASNIISCVWNPTDLTSVYFQSKFARENTQHSGTALGDIIGALLFGKFGGGTQLINLVSQVAAVWDSPPLGLLTQLTGTAFTGAVSIARPAGVYGYALTLVVPAYWGRKCADPIIYVPNVGFAAWRGSYGTVGDVINLTTPQRLIYPLPTGADHLDITIEPGISGTYYPLAF